MVDKHWLHLYVAIPIKQHPPISFALCPHPNQAMGSFIQESRPKEPLETTSMC